MSIPYEWQNTETPQDHYVNPLLALSVAVFSNAVVDYYRLGLKRRRRRRCYGKDWEYRMKGKGSNFVPTVYLDIRQKTAWLFSQQFGLMADVLDRDLESLQRFFLRLMTGVDNG